MSAKKVTGRLLRKVMAERGLTNMDIAKAADISIKYTKGLTGGTRPISLPALFRVADTVGMKPSELLALGESGYDEEEHIDNVKADLDLFIECAAEAMEEDARKQLKRDSFKAAVDADCEKLGVKVLVKPEDFEFNGIDGIGMYTFESPSGFACFAATGKYLFYKAFRHECSSLQEACDIVNGVKK